MRVFSPRNIAGLILILLAWLAVAFLFWHQGSELERNRDFAPNATSQVSPTGEATQPGVSAGLILAAAGLLLLSGCSILIQNPSPHEGKLTEVRQEEPTSTQTPSPDTARVSKLLAQQRALSRTERVQVATEFAASISHEIRNPLAGIQMSLSNMIAESSHKEFNDRMRLISSESVRITDLLSGAVGAARQTPESFKEVALEELVADLLELLSFQMPDGLSIDQEIEPGLNISVPSDRFRHCLANLLLNSIEAVDPKQGWIEIRISAHESNLRIEIFDNGPGFPEVALSGGTRPFGDREATGGGIGLAMVRRFVREVGGQIQLTNEKRADGSSGGRVTILLSSVVHHG
ncbi:MAG: HAMP domain-containing sensor histidine kinase [Myxococcota bacterium]|jgi:signal transduction histidine kinase|nr:HAMP domain-containing sensor histidine kinase [Myxococcota bacterium]